MFGGNWQIAVCMTTSESSAELLTIVSVGKWEPIFSLRSESAFSGSFQMPFSSFIYYWIFIKCETRLKALKYLGKTTQNKLSALMEWHWSGLSQQKALFDVFTCKYFFYTFIHSGLCIVFFFSMLLLIQIQWALEPFFRCRY